MKPRLARAGSLSSPITSSARSLLFHFLLLLLSAQPDADTSRGTEIRVLGMSDPEEVERAPELRIDGKPQKWTESTGETWFHRTQLKGWHTFALRAPFGGHDEGSEYPFAAPLGDGVKIQLHGWALSAGGPGRTALLVRRRTRVRELKWRLCDADEGLPMRKVIDLSARGNCPRPASSDSSFYLARTGASSAELSFIVFFDTLPGLYRAHVRDGRVEIAFVPGAEACRKLAKGAPWVDLDRWRYPPASPDGGKPE